MAINLQEIQNKWIEARVLGTQISALAVRAQVAYTKADGKDAAPHESTIADIKTEAGKLTSAFEAALVAMKTAYTP